VRWLRHLVQVMGHYPHLATRILVLLEQHEQLAYDQVAAELDEPPPTVRDALSRLRGIGFVDVLAVGELEAHVTRPAAYWRLTEQGREKLAELRAAGRLPDT
jgi:predicted ArsR family transcriptional regulator